MNDTVNGAATEEQHALCDEYVERLVTHFENKGYRNLEIIKTKAGHFGFRSKENPYYNLTRRAGSMWVVPAVLLGKFRVSLSGHVKKCLVKKCLERFGDPGSYSNRPTWFLDFTDAGFNDMVWLLSEFEIADMTVQKPKWKDYRPVPNI